MGVSKKSSCKSSEKRITMKAQTTTFTVNNWTITITGNKNMHFIDIEQREDIAANITWEDGQAKVTPRLLSSMTVDESVAYAAKIIIAAKAADEINKKVKDALSNLPA